MKTEYQVNFPYELAFFLHLQEQEFEQEMKRMALVKLFELGKISSGIASKILGISRIDFFDILANYGVDIYNDITPENLKQDIENA